MKKNLTELVFILDRSGSMAGLEDEKRNAADNQHDKHQSDQYYFSFFLHSYSPFLAKLYHMQVLCRKAHFLRFSTEKPKKLS